jgi:hypothetical protein
VWRRTLIPLAVFALLLVPSAQAGVKEDASAAAGKFLDALIANDYLGYCNALAPSFRTTLFNTQDCPTAASALAADAAQTAKDDATKPLTDERGAANLLASVHGGTYVSKKYTLKKLARDLHAVTDYVVVIGHDPQAAYDTSDQTVVLSTETKATRLVLYHEAADGTIYRLVGTRKKATITVAGQGVATPPPTVTYQVVEVGVADTGRAYVNAVVSTNDGTSVQQQTEVFLVEPVAGTYLVSDLLIPLEELIKSLQGSLGG